MTDVKDANTLSPLLEELSRHRSLLIVLYLVLLAIFVGLFWYGGLFAFPEVLAKLVGVHNVFEPDKDPDYLLDGIASAGFFLLQILFIWGGGRIQLAHDPVRFKRVVVSVAIMAVMMTLLTAGLISSTAEMLNRFGEDSVHPGGGLENQLNGSILVTVLAGSWVLWMMIGFALVRGLDRQTALSKLIAVILAGSWIEFTVALPIDLITRERHKDCVCVSGSWLALIICIPILIWSIGPAIYLLYRRELRLTQIDHRRPVRVLLAKSARKTAQLGQ